ncbi:MAG TPA: hypothetical protein VKV74_01005 [Bryobacteraceae bacterium]|nr:hypothetical protein [Bryobacteraceae bacterium]
MRVALYEVGEKGAEERSGIRKVKGEGPVAGFEFNLTDIQAGQ